MLHFVCPGCSAGLRVQDSKAGKLTVCPSCGRKVKAPLFRADAPEIVEELPLAEDEDEEERETDEEYEDRPRKRRRKRPPPPPEEDEGPRDYITRNRFMGAVGVFFGLCFTASALVAALTHAVDLRNPLNNPYNAGGCFGLLLGVLLLIVGVIYAVRG